MRIEVLSQYKNQKFSNNTKKKILELLEGDQIDFLNQPKIDICFYKFDDKEIYESLMKISEKGAKIKLIYHKSILNLISRDNFEIIEMGWDDESECQMHCKFILIDKMKEQKGTGHLVLITSGNLDSDSKTLKNKWDQTMTLIYGNEKIYSSYKRFMKVIEDNSNDIESFREYMYNNDMNYDDESVSCYFFPVSNGDLFSKKNPVYDILESQDKMIYFKLNMAYIRDDMFGEYLVKKLTSFKESDIRSVILSDMNSKFPKFKEKSIFPTHSKNFLISIPSQEKCFVITGSTNAKYTDFCKKANHSILIKENLKENLIYQQYKSIHYSYKK